MAMNILQLISSGGFFGAENVLLELATELSALGHSVTVGVFHNLHRPNLELLKRAEKLSLRVEPFACRGRFDWKTASLIATFADQASIDVIHCHGYKANTYALLANWRKKRPLIATCHNWIDSGLKMSLYSALDRWVLRRFDRVVPVSHGVKNQLLRSGIQPHTITLIENGVNTSKFRPNLRHPQLREALGIPNDWKVIGTVGRLSQEKGHTVLLKAIALVLEKEPHCKFLVVGDGELRNPLQDEALSLGIGNAVGFVGKQENIPEWLSIMDLFVLPSLTEGHPMALLEAMAEGKPVVATDVGDVSKILKNGNLGLVVPPHDAHALAEGMLYYLKHSEAMNALGGLAAQEIQKRYSSTRMAKDYCTVYEGTRR
jgi:glycosyltransferase involved in cell wall biosynthesis